jgi:hypothetical protein
VYGFAGQCVSGASRGSMSLSLIIPPRHVAFDPAVHFCQ